MKPHIWKKSTLGHGVATCKNCWVTLLEADALGTLNECPNFEPPWIEWTGGKPRPVAPHVVVKVECKNGKPRDPVPAEYWPEICWRWRDEENELSEWNIRRYKVVE